MSRCLLILLCAGLTSITIAAEPAAKPTPARKKLPKFSAVENLVREELVTEERTAGDIISQGDVAPLFAKLKKLGWTVAERNDILAAVPADDDFLVRQLRGEEGRKLMRAIGRTEGGYDRLDRLSQLSNGQEIVRKLIAGPDGEKLIQYLADEEGGRELGRMLGRAPQGADFNRPTERIYNAEQLLARLRESHERELARRQVER